MTSLDELYDTLLRPLNVRWRLNRASRRRIILASIVPTIIVAAQILQAIVLYAINEDRLLGEGFWHRLYYATASLVNIAPVAVGALFFAGLRAWSRAEGSWMLLIGLLLGLAAVVFGFMATFAYAVCGLFLRRPPWLITTHSGSGVIPFSVHPVIS
jgi:hypothetical protein